MPMRSCCSTAPDGTTAKLVVLANIFPIFLPARIPELNPVENVWQYLRASWLSNRVFDIIDAACDAWNRLVAQPPPSHPSECESGLMSVKQKGPWYEFRRCFPSNVSGDHQPSAEACSAQQRPFR
ncbi:hypothetical protein BOSEA31B_14083 [Hyphomicrobiales bacterium]|nr:hypothetical protein BOSEA31B_14083 [Hyphomicrobiales bacterium]CAH1699861.1 hypothetical protein BOSEA1005_12914 [Hyphomicrobiales bacterium]CAI0343590.1 hypothetical protein BO1005MUT1_280092 [Hyphomicrobiales bacterium]